MTAGSLKAFLGTAAAVLALLVACTDRPPAPRGTAYQGAPASGDRRALDAPYYTGADPSFQRGSRSGGGP